MRLVIRGQLAEIIIKEERQVELLEHCTVIIA